MQATWVVEQMAEKQAQASTAASAEIHKFQEALEQAQFDNVAYRRAAQVLTLLALLVTAKKVQLLTSRRTDAPRRSLKWR
jgi:hypothetical protein